MSGLIARRLDELAQLRGSEQAEQVVTQKATGRPLPAAVVLLRRLGEIEQEDDAVSLDHRSRREFAILRYVCGLAVLGELIRQDAELTVLSNRHRGRPVAEVLLVTEAQSEVVHELEAQRRHLAEAFPTVGELPLSPRQREVVAALARPGGYPRSAADRAPGAGSEGLRLVEPARAAGGGHPPRGRGTGCPPQCDR